ncbi:phosphate ABC transporter permease subunit PstC [Pikeienuella sp. HZG-20]|uniref:phosphate ABC transporter permease subunit PstC n=1 Tax=Paludibacillus litoralis TaxID=3133267 RepID=UPI0030EB8136
MWILNAVFSLPALVIGLAVLGLFGARTRARVAAGGDIRALAALPRAHGANAALSVLVPAAASFAALSLLGLIGHRQGVEILSARSVFWMVLAVAAIGCLGAILRSSTGFRARAASEVWIRLLLVAASTIAILTTVGIVWSMLFEAARFFHQYDWRDFFFSTDWAPNFRGDSALGVLPLLWGTLYVSFIALAFAAPVGLFAAIYLSEYAGPRMRGVAKPLIEILAGIPTIVYGLFALITVGPVLRDYFAQPLGLGDGASSVMTAGLVMGVMLIPFVSSLSDDIINAVPQAMRDGSYALGATRSETIRQVVIPAALPGIVGALLLATSRAIGETMIVVLGAGAAARLSLNPFEAMTTITVKIVSQLTGDTDFVSPETLVAFALGLTLFAITLCLNVLALAIVRKYREHYE